MRRRVREAATYIRSPFETCPLIRLASGQTPSPWGEGFRAAKGRPYGSTRVYLSNERAGEGTRPYGESGSGSFFFVGAGHWPARRGSSAIPEPTLIRLASLGAFPLEGGRLCRRGKSLSPLFRCARYLPLIRGVVLPYGFQMGRGGPWASRRSMETGRPSVPPLRFYTGTFETLGGRVRAPAPTANPEAFPSFS